TAQVLSLDDYIADEEEDSRATRKVDLVGDNATPDPLKMAQKRERQEKLVEAILKLPEQQQIVLNLYYYEELTLKEIGMVMNVTESRVCQIHSAAMKALRKVVQDTT
ncbi:MAG TPA: sigma-70 family RNA polymerase sigma factor, partial [Candidatus Hydrogenedentes bacterium]|nr:sigma-70 family RNA polymerase sigma factor [Candidatus Hydrogenedentota bacterium]